MSKDQETVINPMSQAKNMLDPYLRATKAWVAEIEKLQQTTLDNMNRAVDEGYKIAKEGMNNLAAFQSNFRKQWQAQMDRANEVVGSLIP
jgi:hypothetical protein